MTDAVGASPPAIRLRPVERRDLPLLFEFQLDDEANRLAGTKPRTAAVFQALWEQILDDPNVTARAIIAGDVVVGGISCFQQDGQDAVGYWIDRSHWGKGIATRALTLFLEQVTLRPLHATVAGANGGSIRVLEKNGFRLTGRQMCDDTERYVGCEVATFVLD